MAKKNKWKFDRKWESIWYDTGEPGGRHLWLLDEEDNARRVIESKFLSSMAKAIVSALNKSNAKLTPVLKNGVIVGFKP